MRIAEFKSETGRNECESAPVIVSRMDTSIARSDYCQRGREEKEGHVAMRVTDTVGLLHTQLGKDSLHFFVDCTLLVVLCVHNRVWNRAALPRPRRLTSSGEVGP